MVDILFFRELERKISELKRAKRKQELIQVGKIISVDVPIVNKKLQYTIIEDDVQKIEQEVNTIEQELKNMVKEIDIAIEEAQKI